MKRRTVLKTALATAPFCVSAAQAQADKTVTVQIRDNKFVPEQLTVAVGTRVRWVNGERRTTHSVLFTGPGGFESERFFPGEHYERVFDKAGRYPYTCGPHPEMKGLVAVAD